MNPFANAKILGHSPDEVLKFLTSWSPKMGDKIKKALALGYTADEIINFLGQGFDTTNPTKDKQGPSYERALRIMGERKPESVKQARAEQERDLLSDTLDPNRLLAAGAGALGGLAAGGPIGAVAGGIGGAAGYGDLLRRYQQHTEKGGSLSLTDWLKSIMKGGGIGLAASQAPKLLAAIQAGGLGGAAQPQGVEEVAAEAAAPAAALETAGMGPEESFKAIAAKGAGGIFQSIAGQVETAGQMQLALQKLYGNQWLKDLETEHNRPAREIIEQAYEFVRAQAPAQQAPQEQAPGIPSEEAVEAQALVELGQPPGVLQAPQQMPATPQALESPLQRTRTRLKTVAEDDESLIADAFHKVFNPEGIAAPSKGKKRRIEPLANALKSSNVRGGQWDAETGVMRIIFKPQEGTAVPGSVYSYEGVDKQTWEDLTGGKAQPITEGSNIFGFWDRGKKNSIGAAFAKNIRKQKEKIPHTKLADEDVTVGEQQIRQADRTFMVSDLFEPFGSERAAGREVRKARGSVEAMKRASEAARDLPDELLAQMILETNREMGREVKEAKATGKSKRFKGGREEEAKRRVKAKAQALKKRKKGAT